MPVSSISEVTTIDKWTQLTQNKALFAKVLAFGKSSYNMELIGFLTSMKANTKNQLTYDKYLKKNDVNVSSVLIKKFHAIAAEKPKPDWTKAPWADATKEVLTLFRNNFIKVE